MGCPLNVARARSQILMLRAAGFLAFGSKSCVPTARPCFKKQNRKTLLCQFLDRKGSRCAGAYHQRIKIVSVMVDFTSSLCGSRKSFAAIPLNSMVSNASALKGARSLLGRHAENRGQHDGLAICLQHRSPLDGA